MPRTGIPAGSLPPPWPWPVWGMVAALAYPLLRNVGPVGAVISLQRTGDDAIATVTLDPPDAAESATLFGIVSWQGGGRVGAELREVGPGRYVASPGRPGDGRLEVDGRAAAGRTGRRGRPSPPIWGSPSWRGCGSSCSPRPSFASAGAALRIQVTRARHSVSRHRPWSRRSRWAAGAARCQALPPGADEPPSTSRNCQMAPRARRRAA